MDGLSNSLAQYISYPHSADINFTIAQPFSLSYIGRIENIVTPNNPEVAQQIITKRNTVDNITLQQGYDMAITRFTSTTFKVRFLKWVNGGQMYLAQSALDYSFHTDGDNRKPFHFTFTTTGITSAGTKLYLNGREQALNFTITSISEATNIQNTKPLLIGYYKYDSSVGDYDYPMKGHTMKVHVFNKALSLEEAQGLYLHEGHVPTTAASSCLIHLTLNEKEGNTTTINKGTLGGDATLVGYSAGQTTLGSSNHWCNGDSLAPITI
jgi:hypothetical protein